MATVTKSIGSSGRDYSTFTAWEADLDDSGEYSSGDDAVGEAYDDSTFGEAVTINGGGTVGLSTVTLTAATGEEHDGTAATGVRNVAGTPNSHFVVAVSSPAVTIEWIVSDAGGNGNDSAFYGQSGGDNCTIRNCIATSPSATGDYNHILRIDNGCESATVTNNICYYETAAGSGRSCYYLREHISSSFHNNTAWLGDTGFLFDTSNQIVKNCLSVNCANTCFSTTSVDTTNSTNNAGSDTSAPGPNAQDGISTSTQFVSTTSGSEDLRIVTGSDAKNNGIDLGDVSAKTDIEGRDRHAEGDTWDIGAHEFVDAAAAGSPVIKRRRPLWVPSYYN